MEGKLVQSFLSYNTLPLNSVRPGLVRSALAYFPIRTHEAEKMNRAYKHANLTFEEGLLEITFHSAGQPLLWNGAVHDELATLFGDISRNPDVRAVIMTGTGDTFSGPPAEDFKFPVLDPEQWEGIRWHGEQLVMNLLNIQAPVIACINGPALRHPEIPLLADIVLAVDDSSVQDAGHFIVNAVPGDGMHIIFPALLGMNRARYFLMTGQTLDAQECKTLGLVNEILPRDELLPGARALAADLLTRNHLMLRYTRNLLVHQIKATVHELLGYGLALQGLAVVDQGLKINSGAR